MTITLSPASLATPTANNNQYDLSVSIICNQLRNRGWYNLADKIDSHFGQLQFEESMNGAEFKQYLISYCQAETWLPTSLTRTAILDGGESLLKRMVEACETQRSTCNLS